MMITLEKCVSKWYGHFSYNRLSTEGKGEGWWFVVWFPANNADKTVNKSELVQQGEIQPSMASRLNDIENDLSKAAFRVGRFQHFELFPIFTDY